MHFDDRLATVLALPDSGENLARIQYKQLIDILGRLPHDANSEAVVAGFSKLVELEREIPATVRARLVSRPSQPLTNPRLVSLLAESDPVVSIPIIRNAQLSELAWLNLIPTLTVRSRGVLRHRNDLGAKVKVLLDRLGIGDRALPLPASSRDWAQDDPLELNDVVEFPMKDATAAREASHARPMAPPHPARRTSIEGKSIGAIVRRIEEFRQAREIRGEMPPIPPSSPPAPSLNDATAAIRQSPLSIDFATDVEGRINWANGDHAPALVGMSLVHLTQIDIDTGCLQTTLVSALRHHQPLTAARVQLQGAPAIAGEWQIDAFPQFEPERGGFTGYWGRLRRLRLPAGRNRSFGNNDEADRLREILHELRTPANAIQVAAEIIQQQIYGPCPHQYRALAAAIAGDCAHILAGFEDLDRYVRLECGALEIEEGICDLSRIIIQTVERVNTWAEPRGCRFQLPRSAQDKKLYVALHELAAERLVWRLFGSIASMAKSGETFPIEWADNGRYSQLHIAMPSQLRHANVDLTLHHASQDGAHGPATGIFGVGFALRLASAEAAAAGGNLSRNEADVVLRLPTPATPDTTMHIGHRGTGGL